MKPDFPILDLLGDTVGRIKVVDVGALDVGGPAPHYAGLAELGLLDVIGFEPQEEACAALNAKAPAGWRYLPCFIGDGSPAEFRLCNYPMTSSLFEPNLPLLSKFMHLAELCQVVGRETVVTSRLDDIPEAQGAVYLKLDVQGAELQVLDGAAALLDEVLLIETEVEFVPLYLGQPLFAEIDQALRAKGFLLHRFLGPAGRGFKPLHPAEAPYAPISQLLWSDAVYVRDFTRLDALRPDQLLELALMLHAFYGSVDLARLCLEEHDRQAGGSRAEAYLQRILAPR